MHSLAVFLVVDFQKFEMLDHHRPGALHLAGHHHHRLGLGLGAALAVELERVLALRGDDAFEAGEEVDVPERAAELAVGDRLQAGGFLQRDRLADRVRLRPRCSCCARDLARS